MTTHMHDTDSAETGFCSDCGQTDLVARPPTADETLAKVGDALDKYLQGGGASRLYAVTLQIEGPEPDTRVFATAEDRALFVAGVEARMADEQLGLDVTLSEPTIIPIDAGQAALDSFLDDLEDEAEPGWPPQDS